MQTAQPRSRAKAILAAVALWLFVSLIVGTVFALMISSLITFPSHNSISPFSPWWVWIYLLIFPQRRNPNLKGFLWIFMPLTIALYVVILVAFLWYVPLALNLFGLLLTLLVVESLAQIRKPSSLLEWSLLAGCGLIGGTAAAVVFWLMLGSGITNLPMIMLLIPVAGLAGLAGGALRHVADTFWPYLKRSRQAGASEQAPAASTALSRRAVLLGLGGLAGLAATGAGFTWLARSLFTHVFPLVTYKSLGAVQTLSWSPDGKHIASIAGEKFQGGLLAVWDTITGKERFSQDDASTEGYFAIQAVAWSPDGKYIALGSNRILLRNPNLNAAIIDATTLRPVVTISAGKQGKETSVDVRSLAWSPDSARLATASDQVQVWDAIMGKPLLSIEAIATVLAWSPDGKYLVTADDVTLQVWDAESGGLLTTYKGHSDLIETICWSPDSTRVASGGFDATTQVWEALTGRHLLTYRADPYDVAAIAWSPDGSRIASAGIAQDVHIWNATTGKQVFLYKGHSQEVNALAWSPDGTRIASASEDDTVQIWQPS
jgi:Tol biopolymer transport system component